MWFIETEKERQIRKDLQIKDLANIRDCRKYYDKYYVTYCAQCAREGYINEGTLYPDLTRWVIGGKRQAWRLRQTKWWGCYAKRVFEQSESYPEFHKGFSFVSDMPLKCFRHRIWQEYTQLHVGEFLTIKMASKGDLEVLRTMIELKKSNEAEFEDKMKQLRLKEKENALQKLNEEAMRCPNCGSTSVSSKQQADNEVIRFLFGDQPKNRCNVCGRRWRPDILRLSDLK